MTEAPSCGGMCFLVVLDWVVVSWLPAFLIFCRVCSFNFCSLHRVSHWYRWPYKLDGERE